MLIGAEDAATLVLLLHLGRDSTKVKHLEQHLVQVRFVRLGQSAEPFVQLRELPVS